MAISEEELRCKTVNTCKECFQTSAHCQDGHSCDIIRKKLRGYAGIRFTADGFDCALPVTIDSHSACSFSCAYCFSDNLMGHRESTQKSSGIGQTSLGMLENIFKGSPSKTGDLFRLALKYDNRNKQGYPCPVQLGGVCDPCDNIERNQGWLLKFMKIAIKYEQPVRMSTKGNIFLQDEYLNVMKERPELFWVAFSIITPDDELLPKIDKQAPVPSERIECMRKLAGIGVHTSLRFRPVMPGISDKTPHYDHAHEVLIDQCAEAGTKAVSYEVVFVPGGMTQEMNDKWEAIEKVTKIPYRKIYASFGKRQSCMRPSYTWTEKIMHSIRDRAHKHHLWVGVSDPVWKQLTEHGCCCGIPNDHPVFGNWERESATNRLLEAKNNGGEMHVEDIIPPWAYKVREEGMVCYNAGPLVRYEGYHKKWAHTLMEVWNNIDKERSPMNYFQGAVQPSRVDEKGNIVYRYVGLERQHKEPPFWNV